MEEMLPPENPMGTAGAALATVIGQWLGCFAGYFINQGNPDMKLCEKVERGAGKR